MFVENLAPFFADFGVVAQFGDLSALVLLDEPDHDALGGRVTTTAYAMTYPTAAFPALAHGSQVVIGSDNYGVVNISAQSDGAVSIASLQRVTT